MSLYMSTAPHVRSPQNTRSLMGDVLIALAPTTIAGIYFFGVSAAIVVALATASAILFEYLWQKLTHKTIRIGDLSAAVTGLLVGLNLPPTAPWWLPIIGSGLAIILVKQLFGGIGDNFVESRACRARHTACQLARAYDGVCAAHLLQRRGRNNERNRAFRLRGKLS